MNTMRSYFLSLLFILSVGFQLKAQSIKVEAHLSKNKILIGDSLLLTINVEAPQGTKIEMPFFTDSIVKGVELTGLPKIDSITEGEKLKVKQYIPISAYDSAVYIIKPLPVVILNKEGKRDTLRTNSLTLICDYQYLNQELKAKIDTTQRDKLVKLKANIETPFTFNEFWERFVKKYWYLWVLGIILIAAFFYWYKYLKNAEKAKLEVIIPKIPAHTEAYTALDNLSGKKLWQSGQVKEFYSELTDILRHYIERRFGVRALEEISTDVIRQIQYRADISENGKNIISNLLGLADYVKFAKLKPEPGENELNLKNAYEFVKLTYVEISEPENIQSEKAEV